MLNLSTTIKKCDLNLKIMFCFAVYDERLGRIVQFKMSTGRLFL